MVTAARSRKRDPLPSDPLGAKLCEIFSYPWQAILADLPNDATIKPSWQTVTRYPLRPRSLWAMWQDAAKLVGVRFGHDCRYGMVDVDLKSEYHPQQDPKAIARIRACLEELGLVRCLLVRSSWSGGIHVYFPLPESVPTFDLAVAIKQKLEAEGFHIKPGQLEIFPNVKGYARNGSFTEYNAHRLPLQPGSGSCLLNDAYQPVRAGLEQFLQAWDLVADYQDIDLLKQVMSESRATYRPPTTASNKIADWKADLEREIKTGWTGHGQTNTLIKAIACYGVVFRGLGGSQLLEYVHTTVLQCPGYSQFCRHQHEIESRCKDWAVEAEGYYWPLGTDAKRDRSIHTVHPNQTRAEDAKTRIARAIEQVKQWPSTIRAQMQTLAKLAQCSFATLQKYRELWCERSPVTAQLESDRSDLESSIEVQENKLEPLSDGLLQAVDTMKGGRCDREAGSEDLPSPLSGRGGAQGGNLSFPQADQEPLDVGELLVLLQCQRLRLQWQHNQIDDFAAQNFNGRGRSLLEPHELAELLERLKREKPK